MPPKPKPEQHFVGVFAVHHEDDRAAQEAQAVGEHAGDRAGAVAQLKRAAITGSRGGGDSEVAPHRQAHAHEADQPRESGPHEEGGRPAQATAPAASAVHIDQAVSRKTSKTMARNCRAEIGFAPCRIAAPTSRIFSVPSSAPYTWPTSARA